MSMVIGTNVASLTAQRHLASSRSDMETSMERLSSGKRVNSAMDDAGGLAVIHGLDNKISSLNQGIRNANDGVSMLQTAEGALEETSNILNRMKVLATQAKSSTYSATDRDAMDVEYQQLALEITRIADNTDFNGTKLLDAATTVSFQVGDLGTDKIDITLEAMDSADLALTGAGTVIASSTDAVSIEYGAALKKTGTFTMAAAISGTNEIELEVNGITFNQAFTTDDATTMTLLAGKINDGTTGITVTSATKVITIAADTNGNNWTASSMQSWTAGASTSDLQTTANASTAMGKLDTAIATVDAYRGKLGATSNRLESTVSNLMNRVENQSAARSSMEDADFASESAALAKAQVLQQAGTAMLAQANASGQGVLSLLK
jgi:flagellin